MVLKLLKTLVLVESLFFDLRLQFREVLSKTLPDVLNRLLSILRLQLNIRSDQVYLLINSLCHLLPQIFSTVLKGIKPGLELSLSLLELQALGPKSFLLGGSISCQISIDMMELIGHKSLELPFNLINDTIESIFH